MDYKLCNFCTTPAKGSVSVARMQRILAVVSLTAVQQASTRTTITSIRSRGSGSQSVKMHRFQIFKFKTIFSDALS